MSEVAACSHSDATVKLHAQLKALRLEMGYSQRDMAQLLAIPYPTYQGYETGRRQMPDGFISRVREWQQLDCEFMAGMNERIDVRIAREYPDGIMSEAQAWE